MATVDSLPLEVRNLLNATLRPGETVQWAAQPNVERACAAPAARRHRITMNVLAWMIGLVALFMIVAGGPIIGGETLLLAGPAIWLLLRIAPRRRARLLVSACVATNQRALNLCAARRPKVESFEPAQLGRLSVREDPDGIGSIVFFTTTQTVRHGDDRRETYVTTAHGFFHVPEVRQAERCLRSIAPPPPPA